MLTLFIVSLALSYNSDEFPVRFYVNGGQDFKRIYPVVRYVEDYHPQSGMVKAYVNQQGYEILQIEGYHPIQLVDTSAINAEYAISHPDEVLYHNYSELSDWVHNIASTYPEIVYIDSLGPTVEGRWIYVVRITDYPDSNEIEPGYVYISTMHGDEPVGTELLIWLCDSLTQNYTTDSRLTRIVDSVDLWVIPMMNPDGNSNTSRYNANGVDLNRNFPVPDGDDGDDGTYSRQPETQAIIDFLSQINPAFTINFHTGAVVVNYPWDFDTARAPDDQLLIQRSLDYSILNPTMYYGSFPDGITNGYDWYEVDGSMQDWHYHNFNVPHITVELNNVKWPSDTELPGIWSDNYDAMVRQLELALTGIRGTVMDSIHSTPLEAEIWIEQVGRWVRTEHSTGAFYRQLLAGNYSLSVIAEGYYPKRLEGIYLPTDTSTLFLDIRLTIADTIYFSDFELTDGSLNTQSFEWYQDWEWGEPLTGNNFPEYIPSGNKLWGTQLTSNYNDSSQSRLILNVDLSDVSNCALIFDQWYRFQAVNWRNSDTVAHDGAQIKIVSATDTFLVSPPWGYNMTLSEWNWLLPTGDSVFADDEPGTPWHKCFIPLDDFCGQNISILWDFGSSNQNTDVGWFMDNVAVIIPDSSVNIAQVNNIPKNLELLATPNPFNNRCEIWVDIPKSKPYNALSPKLIIYDISGKKVEEFALGYNENQILWESGDIPSGTYLINVLVSECVVATKKIVLVH